MELFSDFKNQHLSIARCLINEANIKKGLSVREATAFLLDNFPLLESEFLEDLKQEVFWQEDELNDRLVPRHPGKIPVIPLAAELSWLRALADKSMGKIILGPDLCQLIREIIGDKEIFWDRIKVCNRWASPEYTEEECAELHRRFLRIGALRKNGRLLEYKYRGLDERIMCGSGYVAGFDFWIASGEVYVVIVDAGWEKAYRCYLTRFDDIVEVANQDKSMREVEERYRQLFRRGQETCKAIKVVVRVSHEAEAIERAAHLFASFVLKTETPANESTLYYLECGLFEWGELQQCILALGKSAEVLAPEDMREKFIQEVNMAYKAYL